MILDKKSVLSAKDIIKELVPVPEWGGEVYVRGMSGEERDKWEAGIVTSNGKTQRVDMKNVRAKLAAMTVCDEEGNLLFSTNDVPDLSKKSAAALQRIFAVAQRLSKIGDDDVAELTEGLQENPLDGSASD